VGITPLHEAALQSSDASLAMIKRLLEAGADPNRRTAHREISDGQRSVLRNATPLSIAARSNSKSTEKLRRLLKHGADPKSDTQLIPLLLERSQDFMEPLKLLADAGARPDDAWLTSNVRRASGELRDYLVEKFILPSYANDSEIQLVINDPFGARHSKIAVRSGESAPPDLAAWLLANHPNSQSAINDRNPLKYQWLIWRKAESGSLTQQELEISGGAPNTVILAIKSKKNSTADEQDKRR
jgi:ankyrin repeat protein